MVSNELLQRLQCDGEDKIDWKWHRIDLWLEQILKARKPESQYNLIFFALYEATAQNIASDRKNQLENMVVKAK